MFSGSRHRRLDVLVPPLGFESDVVAQLEAEGKAGVKPGWSRSMALPGLLILPTMGGIK